MAQHPTRSPSPPPFDLTDTAALARALLDILRRESSALAIMDLREIAGFTTLKRRLVAAYGVKLEEIRENASTLARNPDLAELRTLNGDLMTLARRNAALLRGAIDGTRCILDVAAAAALRRHTPAAITYRPDGRLRGRPVGHA